MKILPVNFNINVSNPLVTKHDKKNPVEKSSTTQTLTALYYPVPFGCDDNSVTILGQLKRLKGVHCPLCGVKMLTPQEVVPIVEEGKKVKTGLEFITFINKYSDNINPQFAKNVKNIKKRCAKDYDAPIANILKTTAENAKQSSDEAFHAALVTIDELIDSGKLSSSDKKVMGACRGRLEKLPNNCPRHSLYYNFVKELRQSVSELDSPDKKAIIVAINTDVRDSFAVEYLYKPFVGDEPNILSDYLTNLFGGSKSDLRKALYKFPATLDNTVLSCNHCADIGKTIYSRDLKPQCYYTHIYELSEEAMNGNLSANPRYPFLLMENVKRLTRSHLSPDESVPALKEYMKMYDMKTSRAVEFDVADKKGVPCASCGQTTITHEQKLEIFDSILKADSLKELDNIMTENQEYIVPIYKDIVEKFYNILKQNPNISDDEMFGTLVEYQDNIIKQNLLNCIDNVRATADYYCVGSHDRDLIEQFISFTEHLYAFDLRTEFPYQEFRDAVTNMVENLHTRGRRDFWYAGAGTIPKDSSVQWALLAKPEIVEKVGSPMKAFLQNIFKSSTATVDHLKSSKSYKTEPSLNAYDQLEKDRKSNLVVMCHDCNSRKKHKRLDVWVKNNPEMVDNLPKYLKFVRGLRKNNELGPEFDWYPYGILNTFKRLTGIDLRADYLDEVNNR